MKTVTRYDSGELRASKNQDGYLDDTPVVGRVGIQIYRNADGSVRRELRLPEEIFHTDSLASYKGKPITIGHHGLVNAKTAKALQVGTLLDVGRQDGENIKVPLIIHADEAISQAENGRIKQLSLGYTLNLDETPGVWNGQHYDAIQRNIRVNHLALVSKARAGDVATLNLDGDEVIEPEDDTNPKGKIMQKVRLDNGIEYEAAPEVVVAITAMKQDAEDNKKLLSDAQTTISTLTAERDTLKVNADGFEAKLTKAREDAKQELKARSDLEIKADKAGVKFDGLTDIEIKKAVIAKTTKLNLDGKDDAYIGAAFDIAIDGLAMAQQRSAVNNDSLNQHNEGDNKPSAAKSRDTYLARLRGDKESK